MPVWELFAGCRVLPSDGMAASLQDSMIVLSGNSVMRHLYFELVAHLGREKGTVFGAEAREQEKFV